MSQEASRKASEKFPTPAFLIGLSYQAADGEEVLHGFEDIVGLACKCFWWLCRR